MARIHVSVFGGGLFDTKYTTVYLYLVRFDSESVRRLTEKNPSILADVRVKTVEVYANRSEKNIKRGGCCLVALCTHEHIHNKSAEPSEILFMSERKRAEKKSEETGISSFSHKSVLLPSLHSKAGRITYNLWRTKEVERKALQSKTGKITSN